jgi:hypothetical protein
MPDFVDLGPELFADIEASVITWKGNNYYKACDEPVVTRPDGSGTHCVKRVEHPGDIHEDYDGIRKTIDKGRMTVVVTFPLASDTREGFEYWQGIMQKLKSLFDGQEEVKIYGAVKDVADQLIMILDGEG